MEDWQTKLSKQALYFIFHAFVFIFPKSFNAGRQHMV